METFRRVAARLFNRKRRALLLAAVALCLSCAGTKPKPSEPCGCGVAKEAAPEPDMPDTADAADYVKSAYSHLEKGDFERCIQDVSEAILLGAGGCNGTLAAAYGLRALAYYEKKNYEQVISDASEAIRWHNSDADAKSMEESAPIAVVYSARAVAYAEKGNYDRAVDDASAAIEMSPDIAEFYNARAWIYAYYMKKEFDRAIEDINRAIELAPDNEAYYDTRGWAYLGKGEYDNAEEDFNKALRFNPNLTEPKEGLEKVREARAEKPDKPDK